MENINTVHWHDSEIESVMEIPSKDQLIYNIQYPENWEKNIYLAKAITFDGYHSQIVDEMPFQGNPTILAALVVREEKGYTTFKLETNAGCRHITAKSFSIGSQAYQG